MRFASLLSGGFITACIEVNPPERKLAKRTSVHWSEFDLNYDIKLIKRKTVVKVLYTFVRMPNMKFKYWTDSILHALHHTKSIIIPSKIPSKRQVYVTPRFPRRHNESKKVLRFHQNLCLYKSTILRHTVKLGIKELLNNEQTWLKDLSTDYQPCYTINLLLNKELLPI